MTRPEAHDEASTSLRVSVAAGTTVMLISVMEALAVPLRACGGLTPSYAPLVAFELARTQTDLTAIFGPIASSCRSNLTHRLDLLNWVDALAFVPLYGLFLVCFLLAKHAASPRLVRAGVVLVAVALLADTLENVCLLAMTPALEQRSTAFGVLPLATGAKWLALSGAAPMAAVCALKDRSSNWILELVSVVVAGVALLVGIAGVLEPSRFGAFLPVGIGASWILLLAIGAARLFAQRKPRAASLVADHRQGSR